VLRVRLVSLNGSAAALVTAVSSSFALEDASEQMCLFGNGSSTCKVQLCLVASVVPYGQEVQSLFDTLLTVDVAGEGVAYFARLFLAVPLAGCPAVPPPLALLFGDGDAREVAVQRNGTELKSLLVNKGLVWGSFAASFSCPLAPRFVLGDAMLSCALPPGGSCVVAWTVAELQDRPLVQCQFFVAVLPAPCAGTPQSYSRTLVFAVVPTPLPLAFQVILYVCGGLLALLMFLLIAAWTVAACLKCVLLRETRTQHDKLGAFLRDHMQPVAPDVNLFEGHNE
jgi:hypothetical protein